MKQTRLDQLENLIRSHQEKVKQVAILLLEKETVIAEDLVSILGPRPFGMRQDIKDYLETGQELAQEQKEQKKTQPDEGQARGKEENKSINSNDNNNNNNSQHNNNNNNNNNNAEAKSVKLEEQEGESNENSKNI